MPESPPDRVVAFARASLQPRTLTPVSRLALLDGAFKQKHQREQTSSAGRQALVIIGEGGIGKSVILGQLLDLFEAGKPNAKLPGSTFSGAAVLVSCAAVWSSGGHPDPDKLDFALGRAAGGVGHTLGGLLSALSALNAEYRSVTLLLDTLDLLLTPEMVPAIADIVAEALSIGEVIMTCRAQEFAAYLDGAHQGAPRLANRLTTAVLPKLTPAEILHWAGDYLAGPGHTPGREDPTFLSKLEAGLSRRGSMWEVCSVPVRLALTCEVFTEKGDLPEDLTVTELYNAYWDARVAMHIGLRSPRADAKVQAALAVAALVLTAAGTLRLRIPTGELDQRYLSGLRMLASEGVLAELSTGWEFFHQTFAEYAVARWILTFGADSAQVDGLADQLRAGRTNLWPLAGSLLAQPNRCDDYLSLVRRFPIDGPEGAKWHTVAALRQPAAALAGVVEQIQGRPGLWPAVLPELGNAPRDTATVPEIILQALRQDPRHLTGPATAALAALLTRTTTDPSRVLADALQVLSDVRAGLPASTLDQHVAKLLKTQRGGAVRGATLAMLSASYPRLGPLGRQTIVRVHLDAASGLTDENVRALALVTLATPCPPLTDAESVELLRLFWNCVDVRTNRGWHSWREVLADDLPRGVWHNAKVRFVAELADADPRIRTEIVDELLDGQVTDETSHINAFEHIAAGWPDWLARVLLNRPPPEHPHALGAVTSACDALVRALPHGVALELMTWLTSRRDVSPRQIWPGQIVLAGGSVTMQRRLFHELVAANQPQPVIDSAVDAWLFRTTLQVVDELTPDLRVLLQTGDPGVLQTRARLEGRRAESDPDARNWIATQVLSGASSRVAGTAVKTFADVVKSAGHPLDIATVEWLASLVTTAHTDAARKVLVLVHDAGVVDDHAFVTTASRLVPQLAERLDAAVDRGEDAQLIQAIMDCLIRADRLSPLDPDVVRRVYAALARNFPKGRAAGRDGNGPSAVSNMAKLCGTLMAWRLPAPEVRDRVTSLLAGFDPGVVANKTVRSIAAMLVGLQGRDPEALDWLEELFGQPETTLGVQLAIAEAFLTNDRRHPGGRASRLKDRPGCPPEVVTYIINRMHT